MTRVYLHEDFILLVKRLPVFPVVECCNPHNLLLFVDDGHGEDILDDPPRVVQRPFLQGEVSRDARSSGSGPDSGLSPSKHPFHVFCPQTVVTGSFLLSANPPPPAMRESSMSLGLCCDFSR